MKEPFMNPYVNPGTGLTHGRDYKRAYNSFRKINVNSPCTREDTHSCSNMGCNCKGVKVMSECCQCLIIKSL